MSAIDLLGNMGERAKISLADLEGYARYEQTRSAAKAAIKKIKKAAERPGGLDLAIEDPNQGSISPANTEGAIALVNEVQDAPKTVDGAQTVPVANAKPTAENTNSGKKKKAGLVRGCVDLILNLGRH